MPRLRLLPPVEEVKTWADCAPVLEYLHQRGGTIAIDTETTGLHMFEDKVLFWSMATEDRRWCFPGNTILAFDTLFNRKDITWCMANAKFDMHMTRTAGVRFAGDVHDIIVMDAMVDDTRPHGLKDQGWLAYEAKWGEFKELFLDPTIVSKTLKMDKAAFRDFKKLNGGDKLLYVYNQAPEMLVDYASCDAYFTYMLWNDLTDQLASELLPVEVAPGFDTLLDYFRVLEVPLTKTLWNMERRGILIDREYVKKIDEPMRNGIAAATRELQEMAGRIFNPKSTDDLRSVLYTDKGFGLTPIKYTSGGKKGATEGTDEKTLRRLMERAGNTLAAKFIYRLLELKKLVKLHGTYVKGIDKHIHDGRIHTRYNQTGARTSRLSSSGPNMQNLPRPDPDSDPYMIRGAFIASDGMELLDADYPQIEFRVAAVQAGEEKMMAAVRRGWDIHNANTANMFNIAYEDLVEAQNKKKKKIQMSDRELRLLQLRQESKTVGLGTLYGEGPTKMAMQLGITKDRALELKDTFFHTYPDIYENILFTHGYARAKGHTFTMLGRMRRLHRIGSPLSNGKIIAQEERQAYNTHIQGSAAELMKLAMLLVDNNSDFASLGGRLILTVHDELVAEAPKDTAKECAEIMAELMSHPIHWGPLQMEYPVPIAPDAATAYRWSEAK
jgi:DNA polymerase I-like protein with 3'-5' exonuclease and polymerase domains